MELDLTHCEPFQLHDAVNTHCLPLREACTGHVVQASTTPATALYGSPEAGDMLFVDIIQRTRFQLKPQGSAERVQPSVPQSRRCRQHRPSGAADGLTSIRHRLERLDTQTVEGSAHGPEYGVLAGSRQR